ncbi:MULTISPECIES: TonB-dependent receptor [Sphingobacterium]|uniref:TonB-dependent receptor n=1 Tax=Sphingobacterium TaxID=28453 RepID=UPI00196A0F22|nr:MULTISPECIES: TonB-dependent receptor [unclassified Sphingobacterium]
MKLNLNIKKAGLLVLGVVAGSVVFAQKTDTKGNVLGKEANKKDTVNTLNAQQKNSASIADGVSASSSVFGIRGKVIDVETMKPIAGVSISLSDNSKVTSTNANGEFIIPVNKKGEYKIVSSYLGYNKETTPVVLEAKNWEMVSVVLVNESSTLDEVVVTRRRVQASEFALLEERKNANLFVEKIGAQELSRKGVSDAAGAVTKMSGVSKQEGNSQVYVRGLGDRYNSTTFNGLPLPSSDPEKKNTPLEMFSTDIVDFIAVDKVYNSKMTGDFGGANVDIASKNFQGDRLFELSIGSTLNTNALKQSDNFYFGQGPNYWGIANYGVPKDPINNFNFSNAMNAKKVKMIPANFGVRFGDSYAIGTEGRLSLFGTANFSNNYEFREGENRIVGAQGFANKDLYERRYDYRTNSNGMFNASYIINSKHKLSYNFLFTNMSQQSNENFRGYLQDLAENGGGLIQRTTYAQTKMFVNQLLGNHDLTEKFGVNWGVSYNTVKSETPDRIHNTFRGITDGYQFVTNTPTDNNRYFDNLKENELAANVGATYKLDDEGRGKLSVGYNGRFKRRDFEAIQFNFTIATDQRGLAVDPNNLDAFFNKTNFNNNYFTIGAFAGEMPQTYSGKQDIHAAYASLDYKITDRLTSVIGIRYENIRQFIDWYTSFGRDDNEFKKNGLLPNLSLKYELNKKQNLRLAASKTYTLPQFKERALFVYEDVMTNKRGNPYLYPSDNYNLDLKWEMFPKSSELLSFAIFGKYIKNPINEINIASSTNDISYVNSGDYGYVYGAEIEAKKDVFEWGNTNKLSVGFNTALMKTNQKFDAEKVRLETGGTLNINTTDLEAGFTGASDILINADITYHKSFRNDANLVATVVYNYYSDKLYAIGSEQRGNLVDNGISGLDFILRSKLTKRIGVDLAVKNILNPRFERWQHNIPTPERVLSYKRGVNFGLGLKYQF